MAGLAETYIELAGLKHKILLSYAKRKKNSGKTSFGAMTEELLYACNSIRRDIIDLENERGLELNGPDQQALGAIKSHLKPLTEYIGCLRLELEHAKNHPSELAKELAYEEKIIRRLCEMRDDAPSNTALREFEERLHGRLGAERFFIMIVLMATAAFIAYVFFRESMMIILVIASIVILPAIFLRRKNQI